VVTVGGFQIRQPVGVNERAQDTPNFVEGGILFPDRPQEPKLCDALEVPVDLIFELRLIRARHEKDAQHFDNLFSREH
jgi:hypothetical protein